MWTHADPYLPFELTPESIRYHAQLALYRALNVRRVIALTGSGSTMSRGRLTWAELAAMAVREAALIARAYHRDHDTEIPYPEANLLREIHLLLDIKPPDEPMTVDAYQLLAEDVGSIDVDPGKAMTLLEVAENLMEKLEDPSAIDDEDALMSARLKKAARTQDPTAPQLDALSRLLGMTGEHDSVDILTESLGGNAHRHLPSILRDRARAIGLNMNAPWLKCVLEEARRAQPTDANEGDTPVLALRRRLAEIAAARGAESVRARLEAGLGETLDNNPANWKRGPKLIAEIFRADPPEAVDVIAALRGNLRIARFLTLNYDIEIERVVFNRLKGLGPQEDSAFRRLCEKPTSPRAAPDGAGDTQDAKRGRVSFETGTRRAVMSEVLNEDTIGDLMNFAAYPRAWDAHVFHLHGRVDHPETMVITQRDYLSLYARDDAGRRALEEAREALFGGNDILFVGVGMSEDDVLRPLRQFAARARSRDHEQRRIFALLPRPTGENRKAEQARRAVDLYTSYGVSAIYFGDEAFAKERQDLNAWSDLVRVLVQLSDLERTFRWRLQEESDEREDDDAREERLAQSRGALLSQIRKDLDKALAPFKADDKDAQKRRRQALRGTLYPLSSSPASRRGIGALVETLLDFAEKVLPSRLDALEDGKSIDAAALKALVDEEKASKPIRETLVCARILIGHAYAQRHSRALVSEIDDIRRRREAWWSDWRERPKARRASFPFVSEALAGKEDYVSTRHRTGFFWEDGFDFREMASFAPIRALREEAFDRYRSSKFTPPFRGLRVIRAAQSRGGGHGVLTHLLQRPELHRTIFPDKLDRGLDENLPKQVYAASFFASVGFSPEFSSVIGALTRFFAAHTAAGEIDLAKRDPVHFRRILDALRDRDHEPPAPPSDWAELRSAIGDTQLDKRVDAYVNARREAQVLAIETFIDLKDRSELPTEPRRRHRLDVFRGVLQRWRDLAYRGYDSRLLVCLSGLDRVCDANGDAWSPMHRAFFRMLTGSDTRDPDINVRPVPLDLILINSEPEQPIAYLSEVTDNKNRRSVDVSRKSATKSHLLKWRRLPFFDFGERRRLAPVPITLKIARDSEAGPIELRDEFVNWAKREGDWKTHQGHRALRRFCHENLAADMWLRTLFQKLGEWRVGSSAGPVPHRWLEDLLDKADSAVSQEGGEGLIRFILARYRKVDEKHDAKSDQPGSEHLKITLTELLMKHLSMFWLPIEMRALYDCPEIAHELKRLVRKRPSFNPSWSGFEQRAAELDVLKDHLEELKKRGLVIRILSQTEVSGALDWKTTDSEKRADLQLHSRYSIHGQLLSYFSRLMRLHASDRGDSNHFQVSIFGDQPNDLPTPSAAHFTMVSRILDRQIRESRETLWSAYQFRPRDPATAPSAKLTHPQLYAVKAMAKRLYAPKGGEIALAGRLGDIHTLSHRTRACLGLVRVAFSLGAISRIDYDRLSANGEPAFETYRSWIRALLNIAVALNKNAPLFDDICKAEFAGRTTAWEKSTETQWRKKFAEEVEAKAMKSGKLPVRQTSHVTRMRQPFYRDEIAWLYNERGLVSFVQGKVNDALPLLNRAQFHILHRVTPKFDNHAFRANERRILLNTALAKIERGRIADGRTDLQELQRSSASVSHSTPSATGPIAIGFLGLCDHLSGALERAMATYRTTIKAFNKRQRLRPVSIFNRLLADALVYSRQYEEALDRADFALNAASNAEQRDVLHEAYLTKAGALWRLGDVNRALALIDRADAYGQAMGLHRLEVSALLRRSDIMLSQGEVGLAGEAAARAVAMASRHGMGLRKLSALVSYGGVILRRGDEAVSRSILREAQREAERVGYQTAAARAADLIAELDAQRRPLTESNAVTRIAGDHH